jgi:hypothetical protein
MLHISGDGLGAVLTRNAYKDYHLVVEFKWGERTWHNRKNSTRDSGCLVHCVGPDGAYGGIWPHSIEAQIIEGGTGDFILVQGNAPDGKPMPMSMTAKYRDRDGSVWKRGGRQTFPQAASTGWPRPRLERQVFLGKQDVETRRRMEPDEVICHGRHSKSREQVRQRGFDRPSAGKF